MKKRFVAALLVCSVICSSQVSFAQSSKSLKVGSKTITINSTIAKKSANGYTGSDGTIYSKASVKYTYTKSGKYYTKSAEDGYKYGVANAYCSVQENNAVSANVVTNHEAIYKGNYNSGSTSATYN
ncbi:MAG: hypothetical protein KH026_12510 [Clostridium sp.]|nr:hypothetical protein [Clostridium sp.]